MAFNLNKLSAREKNMMGILLLIFSTVPFFYLTVPSWNTYMDSLKNISKNKSRLKDLDNNVRKLEKYKKENLEFSKKLDLQKLYLAKSYEIDFLVQDLKNICDESSISLESFTPSSAEPVNIILEKQVEHETQGKKAATQKLKQTFEKLKGQDMPVDLYKFPIEVRVTGSFTDIIELFKKLEKYGRVISVENISIGKIQSKKSFGDRLSRSKPKREEADIGALFSTFDLVAYSAAKENEILPFSALEGSVKSTFKFKKKRT